MLKNFFDGKELNRTINPDEAVAQGATLHAAQINGEQDDKCYDIVLLDATPLSLGLKV